MTDRNEQHQNAAEEAAAVETAEAVETEQAEVQAEPTYEDLQARIAELEGQLKDSELRGLANEQNLRRRHQQESPIHINSPDKNLPPKCCLSKTILKWRCSTKAVISMR